MASLKNIFLTSLTVIAMVVSINILAEEQSITVQATGQGINKTEALEDALRNAVRKVVGTYVVTQSKLKEDDFDEDIYINADAVVTNHKELKSSEKDGVFSITIEASVVKNDLLKYITKTESTQITSTDLGNLLNRRKALATAEKSLDYIFKDIGSKMYLSKKVGEFSLDASDELDTDSIAIKMTYELKFNIAEYKKFEKRLKNLLKKVAVAESTGVETYNAIHTKWPNDGILKQFNSSEMSKQWPEGTRTIIFCDEFYVEGKQMCQYHCFAVPKQIYEKIDYLTPTFGVLVFEFTMKGLKKTKGYLQPDLNFFIKENYGGLTIEFRNWMGAYVPKDMWRYFTEREYTKTWRFDEDEIRAMEACTIKVYTGQQARYIWYRWNNDKYGIEELARKGYLPAMIALVEQFNNTHVWYHVAALMGSTYAQNKIGWQNGGLGFEIMSLNSKFMVWSVRKGIPVKRGLIVKSINGIEFKDTENRSIEELSKFIGSFSPGTSVIVEFTNGKKVSVMVQEQ